MTSSPYQHRYLEHYLLKNPDNLEKMIFIAGPRQTGKTTMLQKLGPRLGFKEIRYLNWDNLFDQKFIRDTSYTFFKELIANTKTKPLIIFDELHKFPKWKTYLKGFFDTFKNQLAIIVTGSARLDTYRRGSDSLLGRYWLFHLYPFSFSETVGEENISPPNKFTKNEISAAQAKIFNALWQWGGFPDPFLHRSETYHRRWIRMRRERLIKEDLRDLSRIHDLTHIDTLMDLVIASIGSTLSFNSLRESLNVSYNAIKTWIQWLEAIYYIFRIDPYSKKIHRSFKKEGKYFLYDWSEVKNDGARFENMIAVHLKKSIDFWNDSGAGNFKLRFVRDHEKREVDFLILKEKEPWMLIECKLQSDGVDKNLHYMAEQLKTPHNVLVHLGDDPGQYRIYKDKKYWVTGAKSFLLHFV